MAISQKEWTDSGQPGVAPFSGGSSGSSSSGSSSGGSPAGSTLISGPSGLQGLRPDQIWRDPNSIDIYRLPQTPSSASIGSTVNSEPSSGLNLLKEGNLNLPDLSSIYANVEGNKEFISAMEKANAESAALEQKIAEGKQAASKPLLNKLLAKGDNVEESAYQESLRQSGMEQSRFFAEQRAGIATINSLQQDYNATKTEMQSKIDKTSDMAASQGFIDAKTGKINRDYIRILDSKAAEISSQSAVMQANQGMFEQASQLATQAATYAAAEDRREWQKYEVFKSENDEYFENMAKPYRDAYDFATEMAKSNYEQKQADADWVAQAMVSYNANIKITDTKEEALNKLNRTGYVKRTQPSSGGATTPEDTRTGFQLDLEQTADLIIQTEQAGGSDSESYWNKVNQLAEASGLSPQAVDKLLIKEIDKKKGITPQDSDNIGSDFSSGTTDEIKVRPNIEREIESLKSAGMTNKSDIRQTLLKRGFYTQDVAKSSVGNLVGKVFGY